MTFDPMKPFASKAVLKDVVNRLRKFEYKLYGKIPLKFHRGRPTVYEFDLELGVVHFTEQDFGGLDKIFKAINRKYGTNMMFCIYPAKGRRSIIMNVRGSPKAPSEID